MTPGGPGVALEDAAVAGERGHALLDAGARAVVQRDQRGTGRDGHVHDLVDLRGVGLAQRAAEDPEVVRVDEDRAALHRAPAGDDTVRVRLLGLQAEPGRPVPAQLLDLVERTGVQQKLDPLPGGQLALGVLRRGRLVAGSAQAPAHGSRAVRPRARGRRWARLPRIRSRPKRSCSDLTKPTKESGPSTPYSLRPVFLVPLNRTTTACRRSDCSEGVRLVGVAQSRQLRATSHSCVAHAIPGVTRTSVGARWRVPRRSGSARTTRRTGRSQTISRASPVRGGSLTERVAVRPRRRTSTLAGAEAVSGPAVPARQKLAAVRPREGTVTAWRPESLARTDSRRRSAARAATVRREAPGRTAYAYVASTGSVPWSSQRVCQRRVRRFGGAGGVDVGPGAGAVLAEGAQGRTGPGRPSRRGLRGAPSPGPRTRVWVPPSPRLRLSTTVSTGTPSVAVMPAPRQTIASSRQNQDLRASRVDPRPFRCCPTAANSPSVAPPTQRTAGLGSPHSPPALSASRLVDTVVPGSRYQSTVGQYQSVY